jgi:hypothetical protein
VACKAHGAEGWLLDVKGGETSCGGLWLDNVRDLGLIWVAELWVGGVLLRLLVNQGDWSWDLRRWMLASFYLAWDVRGNRTSPNRMTCWIVVRKVKVGRIWVV